MQFFSASQQRKSYSSDQPNLETLLGSGFKPNDQDTHLMAYNTDGALRISFILRLVGLGRKNLRVKIVHSGKKA